MKRERESVLDPTVVGDLVFVKVDTLETVLRYLRPPLEEFSSYASNLHLNKTSWVTSRTVSFHGVLQEQLTYSIKFLLS